MAAEESVGFLHGDIPYLKVGSGPPLVMVQGLTPEHDIASGWSHRMALSSARPLAPHFTVYSVNRKRGLEPGASMAQIAGHLADAIERDLDQPVLLQGSSTGGSVALQLAADRPELVRGLVVVAAAGALPRVTGAGAAQMVGAAQRG